MTSSEVMVRDRLLASHLCQFVSVILLVIVEVLWSFHLRLMSRGSDDSGPLL